MKREQLKKIIKESIREILNEDIRAVLADQLINVAHEGGFKNGKEFARHIEKLRHGDILNPKYTEKIYNDFMNLDPKEQMKLGMSDSAMNKFLAKYGIK